MLMSSACFVLGEIGRRASLPLVKGTNKGEAGKLDVANQLLGIIRNVKITIKVKEDAAKAAGLMCVGEDFPHRREIMQSLLDSAKEVSCTEKRANSKYVLSFLEVSDSNFWCRFLEQRD
jgi:hypothetical protein